MSKTFDQSKDQVAKLCRYFAINKQAFFAPGVKEAHIRQSLIDPFFEALGWDVRNTAMAAPQYREVIPEDSLEVEGQQKAPDYTFRIGTLPKFYAEAKKCGININSDSAPAYQLRRYGWSGKVAMSLLTNFEQLGVYDCTFRPYPIDKASRARIQYFLFEEYPDRWRELWDVFSRESVWSGAFDQYAASKRKRGTSEVDVEFLKEIEGWREALARNIAIRNKDISSDDLNAAVQRTIDRIVFLRMAEDRGFEPYEQLLKLCEGTNLYVRFVRELCRRADEKYNSDLFHFRKEAEVSDAPDQITPKLSVDDKVFKQIIQSLYFAHGSPYHFGILPVEILGTIYERFLGKVIRLTAGHQAKIEEKPEVRKAGGVYYTPAYIVDYIVKHAVGKPIEFQSPAQLAGEKGRPPFRILDVACGSGSFLLGAYQCLLNHYLNWYIDHKPETNKTAVFKDPRNGQWRLTIEEKKRIMTTHIFGVDVDPQAVEVSKLSLLLKALEGENNATLSMQFNLFQDRALPNLADNIKCGNSLIGPSYFVGELIPNFDELKRVNPFDWKTAFPEAMKVGGFDCIIGNPPWISLSGKFGNEVYSQRAVQFLINRYSGNTYMPNMYEYFVAQGLNLTRPQGYFSFIVPDRFGFNGQFVQLRKRILRETSIVSLLYKTPFPGITADTLIFLLHKSKADPKHRVRIAEYSKPEIERPQAELHKNTGHTFDYFEAPRTMHLAARISSSAVAAPLQSFCKSTSGFGGKSYLIVETQSSKKQIPTFKGDSIGRYEMRKTYWFDFKKENITGRTTDRTKLGASPKILLRKTGDRIIATYDESGIFPEQSLYFLYNKQTEVDYKYLLGVLNSQLLSFYYRAKSLTNKKSIAQVKKVDLDKLPIRKINFSDATDKARHDRMVQLVTSMLTLHQQLSATKSVVQKDIIERQIDAIDAEIDLLVYELYGLTAAEIAIVESE